MKTEMDTLLVQAFWQQTSGPMELFCFTVVRSINRFVARSIHRGGPSSKRDSFQYCLK